MASFIGMPFMFIKVNKMKLLNPFCCLLSNFHFQGVLVFYIFKVDDLTEFYNFSKS